MKNIEIRTCNSWDAEFLKRFVALQKKAQKQNPWALHESISDFEIYFAPESSFCKNHDWCLWILVVNGVDTARLGTSHSKSCTTAAFLGVGYYETLPNTDISDLKLLFEKAEEFARSKKVNEIRLPMQGGFFGSYRARIETITEPYYGEPQTLDRYLIEWQELGYTLNKKWTNFEIDLAKTKARAENYFNIIYKSKKIPELHFDRIGQTDLKKDLVRLLNLFSESYRNFDEFTEIAPEDFIAMYSQYEFIFKNYFCMIVTYKGQDVGFCLAYPDILKPLLFAQKYKLPNFLKKISILIYLKFFQLRYYYPYQGKIPNSPRIKGFPVGMLMSLIDSLPDYLKNISGHYIAEGNPALTMGDTESWVPKNKFGIFKKTLT